jgi:hypothetical protein
VVPAVRAPYFGIDACGEGDALTSITITKVEADHVTGTTEAIEFAVAFPGERGVERVISARQPVPDGYVDAAGAQGALEPCVGRAERQPAFAVIFPHPIHEPVVVSGVTVTYEVDGDEYRATAEVELTACPPGTRTGTDAGQCPRKKEP